VGMSSEEFLNKYTVVVRQKDCLIPMVVLKMNEQDKRCLFVTEKGCAVYTDRPWPCRMYPLDMNDDGTFRMITDPARCHGLKEKDKWPICEWLVEQGVPIYDQMNALFSEITGPLRAMDLDINNPQIYQMTFMALYNLDKFKDFIFKSTFMDRFDIDSVKIEKLKRNDLDLLQFGFEWIKFGIFGQKLFQIKQDALKEDDKS
jgi:hypothetical protein